MGNLVEGTPCEVIVGHVAHSRRFRVLPFVPSEDLRSSGSSSSSLFFLRNSKPVLDAHFAPSRPHCSCATTPLALPGFSVCWFAAVELAAAGARCRHNLFFGETAIDRASLCRIGGEFLSALGWAVSDREIVSNYLTRNLEWWKRRPGRLVFWL